MALKSVLLRNFFVRSSVGELGLRDANCQSRGAAFRHASGRSSGSLAGAGLREGVRFGRWVLGRRMGGSGVGGVGGASSRELGAELALQCHSVAALRVRRILKILQLYKEIYSERTLIKFVQTSKSRFSSILGGNAISGFRSSAGTAFAACLFHWKEESISEAELQVCIDDVKQLEKIKKVLQGDEGGGGGGGGGAAAAAAAAAEQPVKSEDDGDQGYEVHSLQANGNGNHGSSHESNCSSQNGNHSAKPLSLGGADPCSGAVADDDAFLEGWEPVHDRPQMKIWRRPIFDGQLFQYKVYGTWDDVPAAAFYLIQVDLDYRKSWDKLVVKLDVIDRDSESGAEVVHWVTHFPFPMSQRDYVYVRRFMVDHDNNVAVFMSKGVEHPKEPVRKKIVRVHRYMSNMVIKPHSSFSEEGLDYVLTYYDDPQATIPSAAMSWMATTGLPKFTSDLRSATMDFVKNKGMSDVEAMFRRRIGEQPLATLNPQKQKILQEAPEEEAEEKEKREEEEEEEETKWRRAILFDANNDNDNNNNNNNNNLERIGLTDGRADVMSTRMAKEVESSFRLARAGGVVKEEAAVAAEEEEVIVAPAAAMAAAAAAKGIASSSPPTTTTTATTATEAQQQQQQHHRWRHGSTQTTAVQRILTHIRQSQ